MQGIIEFLYLLGIVAVGFILYTIYCMIVRFRFVRKWRNLNAFCKREGYILITGARHQTDYRKELSRTDIQEMLQFYGIECDLPHDIRFFDYISVTYVKPYVRHTVFFEEYRGGDRVHRYIKIQWLENGKWIEYIGRMRPSKIVPYVDADFGGMSDGNAITSEDCADSIERKLKYELRYVLPRFVSSEIERWHKHQNEVK